MRMRTSNERVDAHSMEGRAEDVTNANAREANANDDQKSERERGKAIALAAFATGVFAFGASDSALLAGDGDARAGANLAALERRSRALDDALTNGNPTVLEFYADWCEVCKASAPMVYEVESAHERGVNFVMLNVDNPKWGGELEEYGVDGIPHLVFLDKFGASEGFIVGKFPKEVLEANVSALERGDAALPYAKKFGSASATRAPDIVAGTSTVGDPRGGVVASTDPRAHG